MSIPEACRAELSQPFGHVINGKMDNAGETMDVINPATEEVLATVPVATKETLERATSAARKAFATWKDVPFAERAERVAAWGKTYQSQFDGLIPLLSLEQGKSIGVATFEFHENVRWFTDLATMVPQEKVILDDQRRKVIQRYAPLGVCAAIVPWNFPIILSLWKILPALLMGNCIIVKPSPFTPLCNIRIVQAAQQHFPPGVLQCIVGDDALGPWITEHHDIDKIAFTGSTATGRLVARSCAATLKRVTLELGGNDACIVLPDVDIDAVAPQVLFAAMLNSGQFCAASKRVYIHKDVYKPFSQALIKLTAAANVGAGLDPNTVHGPLNNKLQYNRVQDLLSSAKACILTQGEVPAGKGFFVPLTLIDKPADDARVVKEEAFGPVLPLMTWSDEDDLLRRVNDSPYGLAAVVFGKDGVATERIARRIESGTVWINSPQCFDVSVPFGGWKQSGYGHEAGGAESLIAYANVQILSFAK